MSIGLEREENDMQDKLTETLGTTKFGNDGNIYVLKLYSPTGRKHWYRTELS